MVGWRVVNSVEEYLDWVREVVDPAGNFAFRGQARAEWSLECGAARRLSRHDDMSSGLTERDLQEKFVQYHRIKLIRPARNYGFGSQQGRELGDLEILAKLQHLGAATCLLDFTRNPLIALWMACENKAEHGHDARVVAVNYSDRARFRELGQIEAQNKDNLGQILGYFAEGTRSSMSWYWEPPLVEDVAPRIIRQDSLFVLGHAVLPEAGTQSAVISASNKREILEALISQHGLSSESLYKDIYGFAFANSQHSGLQAIAITRDYVESGREAFTQENFEAAIQDFTEAVYLQPQNAATYCFLAHARSGLGRSESSVPQLRDAQYRDAIEDYDKAMRNLGQTLSPMDQILRSSILHNRGNVRAALGDLVRAMEDYTDCIDTESNSIPSGGTPHYNRANAYFKMGKWACAIADYMESIGQGMSVRDAHFNLANTYIRQGSYREALEHYTEAIA